jgi:hypothetical protein
LGHRSIHDAPWTAIGGSAISLTHHPTKAKITPCSSEAPEAWL